MAPAAGSDAPAPAADEGAAPAGELPGPGSSTYFRLNDEMRTVTINVRVPSEAKVFVNGLATKSQGEQRRFVSRGLEPGFEYTYEIKAVVDRDGTPLEETQLVTLTAGQSSDLLAFFAGSSETDPVAQATVKTGLVLHVPADAKVFLAGKPTVSTGPVREFATNRLVNGNTWASYPIKVEIERDGQTLTREETVTLAAGEMKELEISFDASAELASN
jgi:uncharacterized protein (TIGR03000 family)